MPNIPVSVWEQIQVIIVFAFLLAGMAWLMIKAFSKAVADINAHYSQIVENSNSQWQKYFDARSETANMLNGEIIARVKELTDAIQTLANNQNEHDGVMRSALDTMAGKRRRLGK